MRTKNDCVSCVGRRNTGNRWRHRRIGHGDQRRNHASGLGIFNQPTSFIYFDNSCGRRAQDVAKYHMYLEALGRPAFAVANSALVNTLLGEASKGLFIACIPSNRLTKPVKTFLAPVFNLGHSDPGSHYHFIGKLTLVVSQFT